MATPSRSPRSRKSAPDHAVTERLTPTTLRLYRRLRADHPPEEAIVLLRGHVRMAREYAIDAPYLTHSADLRDQESYLTVWLQDVRLRADRRDRHGAFWRDGNFRGALIFSVLPWAISGPIPPAIHCATSGCAIKHALAMLLRDGVTSVTIDANRPNWRIRLTSGTTLQLLAEHAWPEN